MEAFPDLATLSDDDLRALIRKLEEEEHEISYRRRILHGQIDILRVEWTARLRGRVERGEASVSGQDIEKLAQILARKGPPPIDGDALGEEPA